MAGAMAPSATAQSFSVPSSPPATTFFSQAHQFHVLSSGRFPAIACTHHQQERDLDHFHHQQSFRSRRLICSAYAAGGVGSEYQSDPIDVVAKVQTEKIVVLGGSGFVGTAICKAAISQGIDVVSLSRSGRPSYGDTWVDQVTWIAGGFGTNEQMEKLNGEANVLAINAACNAGVEKFVLISVHDYNIPDIFKNSGYFTGKKRAEAEVLAKFTTTGFVGF